MANVRRVLFVTGTDRTEVSTYSTAAVVDFDCVAVIAGTVVVACLNIAKKKMIFLHHKSDGLLTFSEKPRKHRRRRRGDAIYFTAE